MALFSPTKFAGTMLVLAVTMAATRAGATDERPDPVRAQALFDEGRKLMSAHDYAAACPRLAESQALDPAPGTALNLALCYEKQGRLASAWAAYKTAASLADRTGQKERLNAATKSAGTLEPKLSTVTIAVPIPRAAGLEVHVDGEKISDVEWGAPMPRDGGSHIVEASAPGKKTWQSKFELPDSSGRVTIAVPPLADAPPASTEKVASGLPEGPSVMPPPASPLQSDESTRVAPATTSPPGQTQRVVGLVVGGAGIVGMGVSGVLGLVAKSQFDTAKNEGGPPRVDDSASAVHLANAATIVVLAGAVATVTGAALWLTAPRAPVQVGTNGRDLLFQGSF